MYHIRKAADRGRTQFGWLDSYHSFSFGDYYDPRHMGFRSLRVINDDRIDPGQGFGMHPHRDIEILTYVLDGSLEHRDSLGNAGQIRAGELQRMSAGTGIRHSETNPSTDRPVHLYQIWLLPRTTGLQPSYEQKAFPEAERCNAWRLVASADGADSSLRLHQDAAVYLAAMDDSRPLDHELRPGRHAWLQVLRGRVRVNGHVLETGDGVAVSDEPRLETIALERAEMLLFDLA